jgi:NAD-dependent deacetylase
MVLSTDRTDVASLRDLIADATQAVVFTGAGISTESGIPDFRSPGGIWDQYKPIQFQDFVASEAMRAEYWRRKFVVDPVIKQATPNRGHRAVASLVARGTVRAVITQNIDGLHQESGIPDDKIIELHGNTTYATCLDCAERYELEPATISFGQQMPDDAMRAAEAHTLNCDLFLAIGSSLVVYPAAGFPVMAKQNGARLVILNREATELDPWADLVVNQEIGPTLSAATGANIA